jgi:hypothetical protein
MRNLNLRMPTILALSILSLSMPVKAGQDCTAYPAATAYDLKLADAGNVPAQAFQTELTFLNGGTPYKSQLVTIDTGSTGIVVSEQVVPPQLLQTGKQAPYFYSSSMDYFVGTEVQTSVRLPLNGAAGASVDTTPIGVRAVRCTCKINTSTKPTIPTPSGSNAACDSYDGSPAVGGNAGWSLQSCGNAPASIGMMGVGFDRGGQSSANNPFLNLQTQPGRSGYVISPKGIQLGVTAANANGFKTVQLKPDATTGWQEPQVCVTLTPPATASQPAKTMCGAMLVDTGIDYMFLTVPPSQRPANASQPTSQPFDGAIRNIVPPGWTATVTVADQNNQNILNYSIAPAAPQQNALPPTQTVAVWADPTGGNDFNTGRRLINYAGYMFDNTCGRVGFQASANPPK